MANKQRSDAVRGFLAARQASTDQLATQLAALEHSLERLDSLERDRAGVVAAGADALQLLVAAGHEPGELAAHLGIDEPALTVFTTTTTTRRRATANASTVDPAPVRER